ncbi:MAG: sodium:solute symporter family protein [Bacteroidota bacterium]
MIYIVVTVTYLLILVGIIVYKSRSVKTEEDFVVAGRGVPVYLLVGTLVCTWIGSGSLFGTAGLTFRSGFSELWFSAGAWIGIILVYFIAARVRKIAKYTLTDLLETRYNKTARLLGTITIIVAYMIIAGYQFKGGGRFLNILTEGAIDPETGMLLSCVVIIAFTALAGMVSIVSIDVFNGIIMIIAMIMVLPFAIEAKGGLDAVVSTIEAKNPDYLSPFEGHSVKWMIAIMLPTFLLLMSESSVYQKFSSAKDAQSAKKAVFWMFVGVVFIELLMCTVAVVGYSLYAEDARFFLADGVTINKGMSEEIILRIGFEQVPAIVGSLLFAAGVAIILSTGNTFLMVTSTNVTKDILQPYFFKEASSSQVLWIQRIAIIIIGALAYSFMFLSDSILDLALLSYTMIGASLAPVLLASFFWKRVTTAGGISSIIAGMSYPIFNKILLDNEISFELFGITFPVITDYIAIPSLALSLTALIAVSLLTPEPKEAKWKPFFDEN